MTDKCTRCGSYAINHHCHGRDGSNGDLCDVCYWRKRAENNVSLVKKLRHEIAVMTHGIEVENESLRARLAESEAECLEQARLNGMGSAREARLMSRVAELEKERDELRMELESNDEYVIRIEHNNHSLRRELAESQANDRTAMGYLSEIRTIVGGDDFPDMIKRIRSM